MKKLLLALSIALSVNAYAQDSYIDETKLNFNGNKLAQEATKYAQKSLILDALTITPDSAASYDMDNSMSGEDYYVVGLYYYLSPDAKSDLKAFDRFKKSHDNGYAGGTYMYGRMLEQGVGGVKASYVARGILASIEEQPYKNYGLEYLAGLYENERNYKAAAMIYEQINTPKSIYEAGKVYDYENDHKKALKYYNASVAQGYIGANIEIAKTYLLVDTLDTDKAVGILKDVVNRTEDLDRLKEAQELLGDIYFYGNQEHYSDVKTGAKWYQQSADNGSLSALKKFHDILLEDQTSRKYKLGYSREYTRQIYNRMYNNLNPTK
jgi:hypothetical protein